MRINRRNAWATRNGGKNINSKRLLILNESSHCSIGLSDRAVLTRERTPTVSHQLSHVRCVSRLSSPLPNNCIYLLKLISRDMADYNSIRSRQESADESLDEGSTSSAVSTEDVYSDIDEEKDGYDIDDFQMIKTIGKYAIAFRNGNNFEFDEQIIFKVNLITHCDYYCSKFSDEFIFYCY